MEPRCVGNVTRDDQAVCRNGHGIAGQVSGFQGAEALEALSGSRRRRAAESRAIRRRLEHPDDRVQTQARRPRWPELADSGCEREARAVRHIVFDTNYWKSFTHARLAVPMGDPGCLSLFGRTGRAGGVSPADQHRLLAEHLTAEYRVKTEGRGRTVDEWKLRVDGLDNHWLDCLVGVAVAASIQGAVLFGTDVKPAPPHKRIRLSQLQGRRR
ncbi:MAG: phage terminase large subunit family protein [Phycisphaerae bacterium]|nr:phage terminase large subunit family protein [Phycisphaerae bacterium]